MNSLQRLVNYAFRTSPIQPQYHVKHSAANPAFAKASARLRRGFGGVVPRYQYAAARIAGVESFVSSSLHYYCCPPWFWGKESNRRGVEVAENERDQAIGIGLGGVVKTITQLDNNAEESL